MGDFAIPRPFGFVAMALEALGRDQGTGFGAIPIWFFGDGGICFGFVGGNELDNNKNYDCGENGVGEEFFLFGFSLIKVFNTHDDRLIMC